MGLIQTQAPTVEPLDREELKASHLRVSESDDDGYIDTLIAAARLATEKQTARSFITQSWKYTTRGFPCSRSFMLEKGPVQSIASVKYYDADNAQQTLSSSLYTLDASLIPNRFILDYGESWPLVYPRSDAVAVEYVAGYGSAAASIPEDLLHAMRFLVAHWYRQREPINIGNIVSPLPMTYEWLVGPYRIY